MDRIAGCIVLIAIVAGCGGTAISPDDPSRRDLSRPRDLSVPWRADICLCMGAPTGEPCSASSDCLPSFAGTMTTPQCIRFLNGLTWPGGYCSSPCRPAKTDPG